MNRMQVGATVGRLQMQKGQPFQRYWQCRGFATNTEMIKKVEGTHSENQEASQMMPEQPNGELVRTLKFIENNPLLKQVFTRAPADNLYPEVKAPHQYWHLKELQEL